MTNEMKKTWRIIPDHLRIQESLELESEFGVGFEYNDFMSEDVWKNPDHLADIVSFYEKLGRERKNDTIHAPFLDVLPQSQNEEIRNISRHRIFAIMEIAKKMKVQGVVFHTGLIGNYNSDIYFDAWAKDSAIFWRKILHQFEGIHIYMENTFEESLTPILQLADNMKSESFFGICLDYAHYCLYTRDKKRGALKKILPYVQHLHINDHCGEWDQHLALGDGKLDWDLFTDQILICPWIRGGLIEVNGYQNQKRSLIYMRERGWI